MKRPYKLRQSPPNKNIGTPYAAIVAKWQAYTNKFPKPPDIAAADEYASRRFLEGGRSIQRNSRTLLEADNYGQR